MPSPSPATILVTGGAGYIGSHACASLLSAGYRVVVLDNFSNSDPAVLEAVQEVAGCPLAGISAGDIRDTTLLRALFQQHPIDAVLHFAGLKAVGESCQDPLRYYRNNVEGSLALFDAMQAAGVHRLIFSSSATVYSPAGIMPLREDAPTGPSNPYGQTKWMVEQILRDLCQPESGTPWQVTLLRYFNPAGAHPSGLLGEHPRGVPNNLMPFIAQVAAGQRESLPVFGDDYPTPDGTGMRDYIHVMDLVQGHVLALAALLAPGATAPVCRTYNLGTGQGYSVLEMIRGFERVNGVAVPYRVVARRPGDVAACWADPSLAATELGWRAEKSLDDMLADGWRWQQQRPHG